MKALKRLGSAHFLVAAIFLLVAAVGWNFAMDALKVALRKKRVDPVQPLTSLARELQVAGEPWRFVLADRGEVKDYPKGEWRFGSDMEETLGTKNYINRFYRYEPIGPKTEGQPMVLIRLHIAYYTDIHDAVPHVPEVCQIAGGASAAGSETVTWELNNLPPVWVEHWNKVDLRRSSFVRPAASGGQSRDDVFYLFAINGKPEWNRLMVRAALIPLKVHYAYYAKIEFSALSGGPPLSPKEHDEFCRKFFTAAAPEILRCLAPVEAMDKLEGRTSEQ